MSRARPAMDLYTDSKAALKETVMRPSERLSPFELFEGIKREVAFVAEIQHARKASKFQNTHRDNRTLACVQQEGIRTADRELERRMAIHLAIQKRDMTSIHRNRSARWQISR